MTTEQRRETTLQRLTNRIGEITKRLPDFAKRQAILWPPNLGSIECQAIRRDLRELHELHDRVHQLDVEAGVSVTPFTPPDSRRQDITRGQWRDMTPADRFEFLTWALREDSLDVFEQALAAHGYRTLLESDLADLRRVGS